MAKEKPLSLYPLKFKEVITDVLKVKPEPKERLVATKKAAVKRPKTRK